MFIKDVESAPKNKVCIIKSVINIIIDTLLHTIDMTDSCLFVCNLLVGSRIQIP